MVCPRGAMCTNQAKGACTCECGLSRAGQGRIESDAAHGSFPGGKKGGDASLGHSAPSAPPARLQRAWRAAGL